MALSKKQIGILDRLIDYLPALRKGQIGNLDGGDIKLGTILNTQIMVLTSSAGAGGAATEAMTVAGLLATDVILGVSQSVKGANSLPLLGFNTQTAGHLTGVWSADPGAGAVIKVSVKR